MKIRPITESDFSSWLPLWDQYNSFYQRKLSIEMTKKTWERFLHPGEPMFALVAEKEGKILGMAHFLFHRNTTTLNDTCYLQDLFTLSDARGLGVGKALILAVCEAAKNRGSSCVYGQTHESNKVAQSLYRQVSEYSGFIVYEKKI